MTFRGLALVALLCSPALGYDVGEGVEGHTSTSLGGRAVFYKPQDADHGLWAPGVAAKFHVNKGYAAELSMDFTHHSIGETTISVIPVQATLLGYFYPEAKVTPFLLTGIGWYYTRVRDQGSHLENRWGPHAGVGLSMLTSGHWIIDASYRFLWSQTYHLQDPGHPFGQNFSGRGYMWTLGLSARL